MLSYIKKNDVSYIVVHFVPIPFHHYVPRFIPIPFRLSVPRFIPIRFRLSVPFRHPVIPVPRFIPTRKKTCLLPTPSLLSSFRLSSAGWVIARASPPLSCELCAVDSAVRSAHPFRSQWCRNLQDSRGLLHVPVFHDLQKIIEWGSPRDSLDLAAWG